MQKKHILLGAGVLVVALGVGMFFMEDSGTFKGSIAGDFRTMNVSDVSDARRAGAAVEAVAHRASSITVDASSMASGNLVIRVKNEVQSPIALGANDRIGVWDNVTNNQIGATGLNAPTQMNGYRTFPIQPTNTVGTYNLSTTFLAGHRYNASLTRGGQVVGTTQTFGPHGTPASVTVRRVENNIATFTVFDGLLNHINVGGEDPINHSSYFNLRAFDMDARGTPQVAVSSASDRMLPISQIGTVGTYRLDMRTLTRGHTYKITLNLGSQPLSQATFVY